MDSVKKARMTKDQQEFLLSTLQEHPEMVNGNSQLERNRRLWVETADALNQMGVRKGVKDWLGTYKLFARKTKSKLRAYRASIMGTGGGPPSDIKINDLESKVLAIEGLTTVYGLPGTVEAGISAISQRRLAGVISAAPERPPAGGTSATPERRPEEGISATPERRHASPHGNVVFLESLEAEMEAAQSEPEREPRMTYETDFRATSDIEVQAEPGEKPQEREAPATVGPRITPRPAPRRIQRVRLATPRASTEEPLLQVMREGAAAQSQAARHIGDCIKSAAASIAEAYIKAATIVADAMKHHK